jgi:amidase
VQRISRERVTMFFDPTAEPVAEVDPGERFVVETADSLCGLVKEQAPAGMHIDDVVERLGGACPVTGPIYVRGAESGAALAIEIHRIVATPRQGIAWTGVFGGFGALSHEQFSLQEPLVAESRLLPYDEEQAHFPRSDGSTIPIPIRPFLGTVGVAPRRERRMSFSQSTEYLGDVDLPDLTAGATLILPVHATGALPAFGDAHAAQGDGEITGAAIEIEAEAEVSCRPMATEAAGFVSLPQLNTARSIGSIGCFQGNDLTVCARAAYVDLVHRLVRYHGFGSSEAYQLLGQVGRLRVGNMIDPFYSVLASVERRFVG